MRSPIAIVLFLAAAAASAPAQTQGKEGPVPASYKDLKFPPLEDFQPKEPVVHVLDNGIRVYLMEDHEIPMVRMRAMIRAGSAYEPAGKVGLGSMAGEVMRTGGTATNPGDRLDDELGAMAASIDVTVGALSAGATASCLSEKLPRVLTLFADVLRNPNFPQDKIELAKTAMRTAISRRNDQIGTMAGQAFQIAMYGKESPFAREPEYATVDAITREDLMAFHARFFRADRVAIGFVGSFDSAKLLALVKECFGDWKRAEEALPRVAADPLPVQGRSVYFAEKNDVNQTNLYIGGLGVRRDDPDWPALRVGSSVLGAGGFSSRLMKKVRTELGLAYSVGGGMGAEYDRVGLLRAVCQTKSNSTGQAIEAMLAEIEGMLKNPPTDEEVQLAKDQILNAEVFEYESRAGILGRRMTLDYYGYPADFLASLNKAIRAVRPADVVAAWKRHLDPKNLKIVAVGNPKDFDTPLSAFGPVTVLDLSIPEPKAVAAPASADAAAKGAKAVDALLAKLGGREKWATLKGVRIELALSQNQPHIPARIEIKMTETALLSGRVRSDIEVETPMGPMKMTRVLDAEGAWMKAPNPQSGEEIVQAIPPAQVKQSQAMRRVDFPTMMHHLATGAFGAAEADGRIQVSEKGALVATIVLGADGLPATLEFPSASGGSAVRTLSNYQESGGLRFPFAWSTKDGVGDPEIKVSKVEPNPAIDESIFEKPSGAPAPGDGGTPTKKP